jgi:hypothetical protein
MREDLARDIGILFKQLGDLFKSFSPYAQSVEVARTFKSLLDRLKQVYYTDLGGGDEKLLANINDGYKLLEQMPKCMSPSFVSERCKKEHDAWGNAVQELTYILISEFKRRGVDLGYSPPSTTPSFQLNEENLLKIGFIVVVAIVILNILRGGSR